MAPRKAPAPNYIQRSTWSHRYEIITAGELEYQQYHGRRWDPRPTAPLPHRFTTHKLAHERDEPLERRGYPEMRGKTRPLPVNHRVLARHVEQVRAAIAEGEDLARADVTLPWSAERGIDKPGRPDVVDFDPADVGDLESEDDVAAADEGVAHAASFSLSAIPRESEGLYTVRTRDIRRPRRPRGDAYDDWDVLSVASACDFVKV